MTNEELIRLAFEARVNAYAPYSNWKVGAALLTKSGNVYLGCNIENSGFSATVCAERTAFFKAVSEGAKDFKRIAIAGGTDGEPLQYASPCGICRQVMREFCDPKKMRVIFAKSPTDYKEMTLDALLPESFGPEALEK